MDKQSFNGVADGGTGGLGVHGQLHRHVRVGGFVDIEMADTGARLDDGDRGVLNNRADQSLAPAGDEHVDIAPHCHEGGRRSPACIGDKTAGVLGQGILRKRRADAVNKRAIGVNSFLAAPEHDGIARLEAEDGGIDGHIRARLVDHAHRAQRNPGAAYDKPVGAGEHLAAAYGGGKFRHVHHRIGYDVKAGFVEHQPVEHMFGQIVCLCEGYILGVGGGDCIGGFAQNFG